MNIEMMTKNPQRSDWSLEESITVECRNSFTTNKDEPRRYEKTKLRSLCTLPQCCSSMSPLFLGLILGVLTASLLLAIMISLWLTTSSVTTQISTDTTTTTSTATGTTATTTTTTRTTSMTTTTTTPPYCATTCTGNHTNYGNTTTCGHTCVDTGGYICQSASTYCTGGTFNLTGGCNAGNSDGPCPSGYCCVYDTYNPLVPYLCLICNAVG